MAPENFGNLLQHLTGSKQHNEALRTAAVKRGLHVSEYGVTDDSTRDDARVRDRGGGLRAARAWSGSRPSCARTAASSRRRASGKLPELVELERHPRRAPLPHDRLRRPQHDRGDGRGGAGARLRVHRDHRPLRLARLRQRRASPTSCGAQIEHIRGLDVRGRSSVLAGSEVNIHTDGSLDYDDDLLAELDWVVASMHTSFRMLGEGDDRAHDHRDGAPARRRDRPPDRPADRPPRALRARRRDASIEAAIRTGTFLEINANPDRRDLNEWNARLAAERGAMLVIDSDAHGVEHAGQHALRGGYRTARVDRPRSRGEHARVARARSSAEALASLTGSMRRKPGRADQAACGLNGEVCST